MKFTLERYVFLVRLRIWFQQDRALPQCSCEARHWISENYPRHHIGRRWEVTVSWPPCSPDLNALDFLLSAVIFENEVQCHGSR
jgi:hypothetical protein